MVLKDTAFAILNGAVNASREDVVEAYQFINDNGYTEELSPKQFLTLRSLIEEGRVHTPRLILPL